MSKILFVDDDVLISRMYERAFRISGHEVITAQDGVTALELLTNINDLPDIILMDQMMPKMTGAELLKRIREFNTQVKDIPVVVLTNSMKEEDMNTFIELGATMYLPKMEQDPSNVVLKIEDIIKTKQI